MKVHPFETVILRVQAAPQTAPKDPRDVRTRANERKAESILG